MATVVEHVLSGHGMPADAPPSLAAHYIDLDTGQHYLATGVSSLKDWRLVPGGLSDFVSITEAGPTYVVPPGVSHLRIEAVGPPSTLTVKLASPTHAPFSPGSASVLLSMLVEIVQIADNQIGTLVLDAEDFGLGSATIIGGTALGATTSFGTVSIPSRPVPWCALLQLVATGNDLTVYVLMVEEGI